jgi:hypothetical protein
MYRAYKNEQGTWNVERFSHTGAQVETVEFGLTETEAANYETGCDYCRNTRAHVQEAISRLVARI